MRSKDFLSKIFCPFCVYSREEHPAYKRIGQGEGRALHNPSRVCCSLGNQRLWGDSSHPAPSQRKAPEKPAQSTPSCIPSALTESGAPADGHTSFLPNHQQSQRLAIRFTPQPTSAKVANRNGHVDASVFSDATNQDGLFATEANQDSTRRNFLEILRTDGGIAEDIRDTSVDMTRAYQTGASRHCVQANPIIEKSFLVTPANDPMDRDCQRKARELRWTAVRRKRSPYLWLINPRSFVESEAARLQAPSRLDTSTANTYRLRPNLRNNDACGDFLRAHRRLKSTCTPYPFSRRRGSLRTHICRPPRRLFCQNEMTKLKPSRKD